RIFRLAELLEHKYSAFKQPDNWQHAGKGILADIKRGLRDAYRLYFSRSARDSMFQYCADLGDEKCSKLVESMDNLIANIDKLTAEEVAKALNASDPFGEPGILAQIYAIKNDPEKTA